MPAVTILDVIRTKRDGGELSDEQIDWFITSFTDRSIADEQASALLMAIVWRGLSPRELSTWTAAMIASGDRLDLSPVGRATCDKHSTGGVGDKVSLPLCPIVAACGVAVPQLSGRGLGHTGGTLDKLETVPGWSPHMTNEQFVSQLRDIGAVIAAAGDDLAPADRRMYALRDVTGTVEAIPLIASSIMSKKIAEGTDALVLDVKVGSGAFLPDIGLARELARTMVGLGSDHGVRTSALLTDMDQPLGLAVGNALEVTESVEILQGGDPSAPLARATEIEPFGAPAAGFVQRIDARKIGEAAWRLGAGRARKEDPVSPSAGIVLRAVAGDRVTVGQPVLDLHLDDPTRLAAALDALDGAIEIGDTPPAPRQLVHEQIDA